MTGQPDSRAHRPHRLDALVTGIAAVTVPVRSADVVIEDTRQERGDYDPFFRLAKRSYAGPLQERMRWLEHTPAESEDSTTWSSARCAPATRTTCWATRPGGTAPTSTGSGSLDDPRAMLAEMFGLEVPAGRSIVVRDSSSDVRWMVLPRRPEGTDAMSEEALAELVTPERLVGTAEARTPSTLL